MLKSHRHLSALLAVGASLFASGSAFAQAQAGPAHSPSLLETILEGNPLIIFIWICILATSIIMVTLIIQLAISLKKAKLAPLPLVDSLRQLIASGNYQEACKFLKKVRDLYRKLGEAKAWTKYLAALREKNHRLRALQEELKRAGL